MSVVKLTTAWEHPFLKSQLNNLISKYTFEIDNDCEECDYWIIWGDLPHRTNHLTVKCPPENIFYLTDEAHENKTFLQKFLDQFPHIITCRDDLKHRHIIKTHELNHWHVKKSFDEVNNETGIEKSKKLSVVCSDLTILSGHKKRYAFVNKMIGHFKDRIDVFGRGFNPIDDKWDALAPYKYSIAIENSVVQGYFTEKITECYLAHTFPIYFGAPDITAYFDPRSLLKIDIAEYQTSILKIEELLEEDPWENSVHLLTQQKLNYLNHYQLFPALAKILDNHEVSGNIKRKIKIYGHETFYRYYKIRKFWNTYKYLIYK